MISNDDNPIERYNSVRPASSRLLAMTAGSKNEAAFNQEYNDSPEQIREPVREVLRNPSFRERAKTLGTSIRKTNALKTIAEVIEGEVSYQRRRDQVGY
jgi:UDP:flavonoid glycosyltransferase YjiC (YdhE family)